MRSVRWPSLLVPLSLVVLVVVGAATDDAEACSTFVEEHRIDPAEQGLDTTPPGPPTVEQLEVRRGHEGSGCGGTSCDDLGTIVLLVSATDDRSPAQAIGYRVTVVSGRPPRSFDVPPTALLALSDGTLRLSWVDDRTDDQESFAFVASVRAIDSAGNVGPATTIELTDEGSGGCTIGVGGAPAWPWVVAAAALALLRARRRG